MTLQGRPNKRTPQPPARARDRAMERVRRTTGAVCIAAVGLAVGLGILVASETTAHSSATTSTNPSSSVSTPTTSASPSSSSSNSSSATTTTPTTTATTPTATRAKPTTVSGQS
jgi:cytoskeletal protein RodZ